MKVIPLDIKKKRGRVINIQLPNGATFSAHENDMRKMFEDPKSLTDSEKEGLLQLAIAVVFAEHRDKAASCH